MVQHCSWVQKTTQVFNTATNTATSGHALKELNCLRILLITPVCISLLPGSWMWKLWTAGSNMIIVKKTSEGVEGLRRRYYNDSDFRIFWIFWFRISHRRLVKSRQTNQILSLWKDPIYVIFLHKALKIKYKPITSS